MLLYAAADPVHSLLLHSRRPMRLGGGLGGDSRAAKEPRKKLLAEAAARGQTLPAAEAPVRYSDWCSDWCGAAVLVRSAVRRATGSAVAVRLTCLVQLLLALYSLVAQQRQHALLLGFQGVLVTRASAAFIVYRAAHAAQRMHVQIVSWQQRWRGVMGAACGLNGRGVLAMCPACNLLVICCAYVDAKVSACSASACKQRQSFSSHTAKGKAYTASSQCWQRTGQQSVAAQR
jgi:hypothetical protein